MRWYFDRLLDCSYNLSLLYSVVAGWSLECVNKQNREPEESPSNNSLVKANVSLVVSFLNFFHLSESLPALTLKEYLNNTNRQRRRKLRPFRKPEKSISQAPRHFVCSP